MLEALQLQSMLTDSEPARGSLGQFKKAVQNQRPPVFSQRMCGGVGYEA